MKKVANIVRGLSADAVEKANSGHPGLPIGCAEIGAVLYGQLMKYDPSKVDWPDRDRFVLSAGHGSMLLYSYLHLAGFDLSLEDLKNFRQLHSKTPGHPEYGQVPGVETTTGPLGQGFSNAVGMALAERMLAERFNTAQYKIIDHFTYTLLGDGCMMEGITSEAASLAGHLGLGKLIAIYDNNQISIEGETGIAFTESVGDRFKAYHWHVIDGIDGHDVESLQAAIKEAQGVKDKPSLIIANTKIAFGTPTKEGTAAAHGAPLGEDEIKGLKRNIGLPIEKKFYVSEEVKEFFAKRAKELSKKRKAWEDIFEAWSNENPKLREKWDNAISLKLPVDFKEKIEGFEITSPVASRQSSGMILQMVAEELPYLIGGSADLSPSTKTYLNHYKDVQKTNYKGRNLHFGIREHAMGAIVNGISAHGGLRPFCSTFLVFSDYMRSSIRMAALMKLPVIYIFTHDSFYVGEDGPTHQPVEQVESLRLIPGLKVIRPADADEVKAAWIQAIEKTDGPTVLILTRQALPHLNKLSGLKGAYQGGYIITKEAGERPDLVLMASGSEVSMAVEVANLLKKKGKDPRVVSIPDRKQFVNQGSKYMEEVLGRDNFRVAIEAGVGNGWYRLLGARYHLVSVEDFGESGPAKEVAEDLGFTAEKIAKDILEKI